MNYCVTCVNCRTPICDSCTYVVKAGGERSEPLMYIHGVDELAGVQWAEGDDIETVRARVVYHLMHQNPIPLKDVMRYNELVGKRED